MERRCSTLRAELFQSQLVRSVHRVFLSIIIAAVALFAHQADDFPFISFLCHIGSNFNRSSRLLQTKPFF